MSQSVELRGPCPRDIVDVLDAIAQAKRTSRMQVVIEVLGRFTDEQRQISESMNRINRGRGKSTEGWRKDGGSHTDGCCRCQQS